jgi:large subunit ribosomal protein L25
MEVALLEVEERASKGSNEIRRLRDSGKIPMIIYGGGGESISLQADYGAVKRHLSHHLRVYKLNLGGQEMPGYLKTVQWDCLTDEPLHIDFQRIEMDVPLRLSIQLATLGRPVGEASGGRVIIDNPVLHLSCMPDSVPMHIEIAISDLDIGDQMLAKDLPLPSGVTLDMPGDAVIIRVVSPEA